MATLHICLFGQFHARRDEQPITTLHMPRVQELLCYLLLNPAYGHSRDTLAGRLWGNDASGAARKALRQTLWQLQGALDKGTTADEPPVLLIQRDSIALNAAADLWLDTSRLERVGALVREVPGARLDAEQARALEEAIDLYRGDLLDGWYQDWCLFERERLQSLYLGLVNKLMGYCEANRRYEAGLEYGARILRVDRARERTHWRMMRLYYLLGDRTAALRQYQLCVAALKEELDLAPAARTQALYQHIRFDQATGDSRRRRSPRAQHRRAPA